MSSLVKSVAVCHAVIAAKVSVVLSKTLKAGKTKQNIQTVYSSKKRVLFVLHIKDAIF